jgi:excinuclease ABC subunit B
LAKKRRYDKFLRHLTDIQYERNDYAMERGTFRAKGDVIDVISAGEEVAYRIEFFGDEIETLKIINPLTGEVLDSPQELTIFPSSHYVTPRDKLNKSLSLIQQEMETQSQKFQKNAQFIEHQRIKQRVEYDLEMMRETGFVKGIENYSRYLTNREPGEQPATLLDYFPDDYLVLIDESHMTIPQIRGMYNGDRARKEVLVEHGFRLPSALDNRPLTFAEFENHINQAVYISATPGPYELEKDPNPAQQVIRPTGLLDPQIEIRPTKNQVDDLIAQIRQTIKLKQRVLATTLTKRMAEDLSDHLEDLGIKAAYLHSDVDTVERTDILRDLRLGVYDVLIGINLLREGLDLPEVSLVAILDADREGFLRSESALVQTIGRAARHVEGRVIMYADSITGSMQRAISETERRRKLQLKFNAEHNITPTGITKQISQGLREIINSPASESIPLPRERLGEGQKHSKLGGVNTHPDPLSLAKNSKGKLDPTEKKILISDLQAQMELASQSLQFELAAELRDTIHTLQN